MSACRAINAIGHPCQGCFETPHGLRHESRGGMTWTDAMWDIEAADRFIAERVAAAKAMDAGETCRLTKGEYLDSNGSLWGICGWSMTDSATVTGDIEFTRLNGPGRFVLRRTLRPARRPIAVLGKGGVGLYAALVARGYIDDDPTLMGVIEVTDAVVTDYDREMIAKADAVDASLDPTPRGSL